MMAIYLRIIVLFYLPLFTGCNHLFYHPRSEVFYTPEQFEYKHEDLSFASKDGIKLSGWRLKAKVRKKMGTVLQFHGNGENMTTHFTSVAWLTNAGFDVIVFDYRGYGKSAGSPSRQGLVEDGIAAINLATKDDENFYIVAQSLGGAVAVPAIKRAEPKDLRALIIESSFASYRDVARSALANHWITWAFQWPLAFLVSDELSPGVDATALNTALLDFHGDRDRIVASAQGQTLYDAFASQKKEFVTVKGGGHLPAVGDPKGRYQDQIVEFLCHHNTQPKACIESAKRQRKSN